MSAKPTPPPRPVQPVPLVRHDGADPYRHQEMQFDYYEPARLHRSKMLGSGPVSLLVFLGLDASYGVFLCLDYLPNGLAFFGVQAALLALALWSRRSSGEVGG